MPTRNTIRLLEDKLQIRSYLLNVLSNVYYYSQLPFEFLFESGLKNIVKVFSVKDCLIMNRLTPSAVTNSMVNSASVKILTQVIRIKEEDKQGKMRCKYFYGSKVSFSDLITNIGVMQVSSLIFLFYTTLELIQIINR